MSDHQKPNDAEIAKLVGQLNSLKSHEEKCKFYHDNKAIHSVIRGHHFPKTESNKDAKSQFVQSMPKIGEK